MSCDYTEKTHRLTLQITRRFSLLPLLVIFSLRLPARAPSPAPSPHNRPPSPPSLSSFPSASEPASSLLCSLAIVTSSSMQLPSQDPALSPATRRSIRVRDVQWTTARHADSSIDPAQSSFVLANILQARKKSSQQRAGQAEQDISDKAIQDRMERGG